MDRSSDEAKRHWQSVFETKADGQLSWNQPQPERGVRLIRAYAPDPGTAIIDVGAGASYLFRELKAAGYRDLTGLDISPAAIGRARQRLGEAAAEVAWITADVTSWTPPRRWGLWHDRAVFHFMTDESRQDGYIGAMQKALPVGGTAIIATFAPDGPERCSGLPVQRYDAESLAERLGAGFRLIASEREEHVTPWGSRQRFVYAVLSRV